MNKQEKIEFITGMMDMLKSEMLNKIDRIPEDWDGVELRWYTKDKADEVVWSNYRDKRASRYKKYENDMIINNL